LPLLKFQPSYMEFRRDFISDPCDHVDRLICLDIIKDGGNM